VLQQWQNEYRGNLLVFLPDTFGTTQFLKGAPQWVSFWTGARPDSKPPVEAGEELIAFWKRMGLTDQSIASAKLIIFSDALDVGIDGRPAEGNDIVAIARHFEGRVPVAFGWGTHFSNDFEGSHPRGADILRTISLVCKISSVNGRPAVKLSDNAAKAIGPQEEVEAYREIFGTEGVTRRPLKV
jgi:nicotinate phosphoribosyltransferase